jgi:hypothetical protein
MTPPQDRRGTAIDFEKDGSMTGRPDVAPMDRGEAEKTDASSRDMIPNEIAMAVPKTARRTVSLEYEWMVAEGRFGPDADP